jgi:hypothetical protein
MPTAPISVMDASRRANPVAKGWRKPGEHLTSKERQDMPRKDFALPGKGDGPKGSGAGSYPINDESHARAALSRVSANGSSAEKSKVRAAVGRKYPDIVQSGRAEHRYRSR